MTRRKSVSYAIIAEQRKSTDYIVATICYYIHGEKKMFFREANK